MTSSEFSFNVLQARPEKGFFEFLFAHIQDGVIVTDETGIVVFWNVAAEKLYGFSSAEMVGHHIGKLGPGFVLDDFKRRLKEGKPSLTAEWEKEFGEGDLRTFEVTTTSLSNTADEFIGIMGVSKEITTEKQLRNELEDVKFAAEETSKLKTAFLSNLSHEIKTPMAGIIGLAELIQSTTDNEDLRNYAQIQKDSCERLLNTMRSILEMSRLDSQQNHFSAKICNLNEMIDDLIPSYRILAEKKGLNFLFNKSPEKLLTLIDPFILTQIVSNLTSNAIKYTPEGSVQVGLTICENNSNRGCLTIKDTGIGMDTDFAMRLFEPYTRENREEVVANEGSGIGLNIAYQYIRMLGWNIMVTTDKGQGSEFKVHFPLFDSREVTKRHI